LIIITPKRIFLDSFHQTSFEFFQLPKAATHCGRYSYKVSWSLMKGIKKNSLGGYNYQN
jgi:hypothetical protein